MSGSGDDVELDAKNPREDPEVPVPNKGERQTTKTGPKKYLRTILSEMLATFILVFCGATVVAQFRSASFSFVAIGLAHGYALWAAITCFGHYSAICNPSVSFCFMFLPIRRHLYGSFFGAFLQMLAEVFGQHLGSVLAGWCTWMLEIPVVVNGDVTGVAGSAGVPSLNPGVTKFQGWLYEFIGSMILMWVILVAVYDGPVIKTVKTPSYSIGMCLGLLVLVGGNISGSSLNFARYFGPALFGAGGGPTTGFSADWWIYFTAPICGMALTTSLWYNVFRKSTHMAKTELLAN